MKLSRANPTVKSILAKSFPNYRGRKIALETSETISFGSTFSSGGSYSKFILLDLATGKAVSLNDLGKQANDGFTPSPWCAAGKAYFDARPIPPNALIVEHVVFCGHDLGIRMIVHPSALEAAQAKLGVTLAITA